MKKEYLPLVGLIAILIVLNSIFNTFPIDGILYLGCIITVLVYVGNVRNQNRNLDERISQLEKNAEEKEKGE